MSDISQDNSGIRAILKKFAESDDGLGNPSDSDCAEPSITGYVSSVPCPGNTYGIHLKGTNKVISITEGEVVLQSLAEAQCGGGWLWTCEEKGNWLGFRNRVSGRFLGHNGESGLHAEAKQQNALERFCIRHHPRGGYLLLVKYPRGEELRQIGYASDEKTLVEKEKDGAQWMFEEV